jgi:hypothetical protein
MRKQIQIHTQNCINSLNPHNQEQGDLGLERFKTREGLQLTGFRSGLFPLGAHLQVRLQSWGHRDREEAYINFVCSPVGGA